MIGGREMIRCVMFIFHKNETGGMTSFGFCQSIGAPWSSCCFTPARLLSSTALYSVSEIAVVYVGDSVCNVCSAQHASLRSSVQWFLGFICFCVFRGRQWCVENATVKRERGLKARRGSGNQ